LIVIAILAILATTVVLVLNPAQILAQARDAQRISDLSSVKSAIALYLATATTPAVSALATCTVAGCMGVAVNDGPFDGILESLNTTTGVLGAGWVLVDLSGTAGGSSLSALPVDPTNLGNFFYAYRGTAGLTFELDSRLESQKYQTMMVNDGGNRSTCSTFIEATCYYETGTVVSL
ncbi:MAG: hypothetical protein AAB514_02225, partial [Patescibacteria group bacterium]